MRGFFFANSKELTFCKDLVLRIWPKFAKFAKINPLEVPLKYGSLYTRLQIILNRLYRKVIQQNFF